MANHSPRPKGVSDRRSGARSMASLEDEEDAEENIAVSEITQAHCPSLLAAPTLLRSPSIESSCATHFQVLLNPRSATAAKFDAATNLCYLARPRQGSMSLVREMGEAIAPLVSMLRDTSSVAGQKIAATALARLAVTDENKLHIAQAGGIDVLIVQVCPHLASVPAGDDGRHHTIVVGT